MLIDTHSHIYDEKFDTDREEVVSRALAAGVGHLLLPAIDDESYENMFSLVRQHPDICHPMMGLHPTSVNNNPGYREALEQVARYLENPPSGIRFCGIGEIGLDFYWNRDFITEQTEALKFQFDLALRYDLPVIIHTRDTWDEMTALIETYRDKGLRGIMHSFSGTPEHYRRIKAAGGFLFGIGGPVTYKKSAVAETVRQIPLDDLVLETDSPYLPPVPFRGQRNESSYVKYVCEKIAELHTVSPQEVADITTANVRRMFRNTDFC